MKKLMAGLVTAALAGVMCFSLAGCGGHKYSETFQGAISEETYESVESAVKGFLEEEVSGLTVQAEYVGYEKEAELSQKEIDDLPLGEYTEGLLSVEKGQVEYRETEEEGVALTAASSETTKRTVYILSYTDMFRFFVPPVNTGETLTAKYYDSVFQAEKYYNCTMRVVMKQHEGEHLSNSSVIAKATETALYEEDYQNENFSGDRDVAYGLEKDGSILWYYSFEDEPFRYGYSESGSVKNFFSDWFDMRFGNLDHTYFEKTETGYSLRAEKYAALMESLGLGSAENYTLEYVFNVADGRLADVHMKIEYGELSSVMDIKFSDFGSTKVTVPEEVKTLMEE